MLASFRMLADDNGTGIAQWTSATTASSGAPRLLIAHATGHVRVYLNSNYLLATPAGSSGAGRYLTVIVTSSAAANVTRLYYNGSSSVTGTAAAASTNNGDYIHFANGFGSSANANTVLGCFWEGRALSEAEAIELSANPWQLFRPITRRIYVPSAGAPSGLSLDVDTAGAVAVAGQTALGNTNIAVGTAGAVAIAGQTASAALNLAVGTAGAVAVAGQDVTLEATADLSLAVDTAGAVTVAGQDVTLAAGGDVAISIDTAGAISVAGQSVAGNLNVAVGTAGAVGVAGQTALHGLNLAVGTAGSIAVAGQDVVITAALDLTLEIDVSGLITVAGQEVGINVGGLSAGLQPAGGGKSRKPSKRRRKPVLVEIDGQQFVVNSEAEAVELAEKASEAAKEVAERQAAEIVAKREKKGRKAAINTSPLRLDEPLIDVKPLNDGSIDQKWLAEVSERMDSIREAYRSVAERYETAMLLRVKEELDEEDTLVALFLTF